MDPHDAYNTELLEQFVERLFCARQSLLVVPHIPCSPDNPCAKLTHDSCTRNGRPDVMAHKRHVMDVMQTTSEVMTRVLSLVREHRPVLTAVVDRRQLTILPDGNVPATPARRTNGLGIRAPHATLTAMRCILRLGHHIGELVPALRRATQDDNCNDDDDDNDDNNAEEHTRLATSAEDDMLDALLTNYTLDMQHGSSLFASSVTASGTTSATASTPSLPDVLAHVTSNTASLSNQLQTPPMQTRSILAMLPASTQHVEPQNSTRAPAGRSYNSASPALADNIVVESQQEDVFPLDALLRPSMPTAKRKRANFSDEQTDVMRSWLLSHVDHPYPNDKEKWELVERTGLTLRQVNNWLINSRRRMLDPQTYQQARHNQFNVKARDRNEVNADVHEETEEEEKEEEPQNEVGSSSRGNRTSPRLRAKRTMRRARG